MNTLTLHPNSHLALTFSVPFNGAIRYEVNSELPTYTFVVDAANLNLFRQGQKFQWYGGVMNVTEHRFAQTLPFRGTWFLLIVNYNTTMPTAVHYNVWST